jgi:diguanylate cyclase (GGDEF)-like protein
MLESNRIFEKPIEDQTLSDIMGRRPRLLVVDDQAANVQVIFKAFSQDHQVFMATSGNQAINVCTEKMPDLVLLDIEMPDINGFEVCSRLKSNPLTKDIPVIFVTSHDNEQAEAKGFAVGAVDFITKPISREIVRARVRTHLLLKQQADLLRKWVYMDGLTGVFNRRHFNERYSAEWGRAFRHGGPLSLIFIDVDFFKKYNDHYGHQMGDEVLRKIAGAFKGVISRSADLVARYGGEEFVCLLPDTDAQGSYVVAKQISEAVRSLKIEHIQSTDHKIVTVSMGVATFHGGCKGGADDLLRMADECLYQAKHRGRNRINSMLAPLSSDSIMPSSYQPPVIDRTEDHYGP